MPLYPKLVYKVFDFIFCSLRNGDRIKFIQSLEFKFPISISSA